MAYESDRRRSCNSLLDRKECRQTERIRLHRGCAAHDDDRRPAFADVVALTSDVVRALTIELLTAYSNSAPILIGAYACNRRCSLRRGSRICYGRATPIGDLSNSRRRDTADDLLCIGQLNVLRLYERNRHLPRDREAPWVDDDVTNEPRDLRGCRRRCLTTYETLATGQFYILWSFCHMRRLHLVSSQRILRRLMREAFVPTVF